MNLQPRLHVDRRGMPNVPPYRLMPGNTETDWRYDFKPAMGPVFACSRTCEKLVYLTRKFLQDEGKSHISDLMSMNMNLIDVEKDSTTNFFVTMWLGKYHSGAELRTDDDKLWENLRQRARRGIIPVEHFISEDFVVAFHAVHSDRDIIGLEYRDLSIRGGLTIRNNLWTRFRIQREFLPDDASPRATRDREWHEAIMKATSSLTKSDRAPPVDDTGLVPFEKDDGLPNPDRAPWLYHVLRGIQEERDQSIAQEMSQMQLNQQHGVREPRGSTTYRS
ncbi:hypothetical protein F4778DRAFT_713511 [Xylariomycetidae sp. FL2044]|nr:hypothetical protein F4778DRAFT_713511 [Xylariomycetidae sp. FL2044]